MLFDAFNLFSEKQAITGDAASQRSIDLGEGYPLSGNSNGASDMELVLVPVESFQPSGETLTVEIRTSDQRDSNGNLVNPKVLTQVPISTDDLKAAATLGQMPRLPITSKRFVDLHYTVSNTLTVGKLTAGLVVTRATI